MKKIRVVIAHTSFVLRDDVYRTLDGEIDIEIVGEAATALDVLLTVRNRQADAVVMAVGDVQYAGLGSHLLSEFPKLTIIGVAGDCAFVEQLCPSRRELLDASAASVLTSLRHSVRCPCTF